jgi:hypothetical protein
MENIPKSKGKEKARKELWDSLCAVYENEVWYGIGKSVANLSRKVYSFFF